MNDELPRNTWNGVVSDLIKSHGSPSCARGRTHAHENRTPILTAEKDFGAISGASAFFFGFSIL
jgi:hypothetical protein